VYERAAQAQASPALTVIVNLHSDPTDNFRVILMRLTSFHSAAAGNSAPTSEIRKRQEKKEQKKKSRKKEHDGDREKQGGTEGSRDVMTNSHSLRIIIVIISHS
jgi:hypothetical protein